MQKPLQSYTGHLNINEDFLTKKHRNSLNWFSSSDSAHIFYSILHTAARKIQSLLTVIKPRHHLVHQSLQSFVSPTNDYRQYTQEMLANPLVPSIL